MQVRLEVLDLLPELHAPMRIIHLADTHLGFRQFAGKLHPERRLNQRECDVYDMWHRAIDIAIERRRRRGRPRR